MNFPVDAVTLLTFIPAALALNLTPGADMMFCLGQGLRGGWRAAMAADLGIVVGGWVGDQRAGWGVCGRAWQPHGAVATVGAGTWAGLWRDICRPCRAFGRAFGRDAAGGRL